MCLWLSHARRARERLIGAFSILATERSLYLLRRCQIAVSMSRGNQRDKDRQRAAARAGKDGKKNDDGLTPAQRNERCVN